MMFPRLTTIHHSTTRMHQHHTTRDRTTTTTTIQSGEAPFLTGEELPPHSGELNRALSQEGGPTQSQLSRHMSSGHHISMEHRLRRKHLQLNSDIYASNETFLKKQRRKKEETDFLEETREMKNMKARLVFLLKCVLSPLWRGDLGASPGGPPPGRTRPP